MGFVARDAFEGGWQPNADPVNGPRNALLRADNLMLDERGVPSLRPFAQTVASLGGDVHSLFSTPIGGTTYRMAGVGNSVYANGAAVAAGLAGAGDVAFGFHYGNVRWARSTTKQKYDGATVRNWGIAMTGAKPTIAAVPPDGKLVASGAENGGGTTPPGITWFAIEKAAPNGVVTWGPNHYDTGDPAYSAVGAIVIALAPTKRAVYEIDFFPLPGRDYTVYDGGTLANDDDLLTCYIWLSDPKLLTSFNIQFDVNKGNFLDDWYNSPSFDAGQLQRQALGFHRVSPAPGETLPDLPPGTVTAGPTGTAIPRGSAGSGGSAYPNAGWQKVVFRRGDFTRQGNTTGKGWNTVRACRLVVIATAVDLQCRVDTIRFQGGALIGTCQWRYQYVRNANGYQAVSALSPASDQQIFDHQAAQVAIPFDGSRDSQVNEIWVFRWGQNLDTFYRVKLQSGITGTAGFTFTDQLRDVEVLEIDIKAVFNLTVPPDNIIGIAGPHFDRTFVLTSDGQLWPSQKLDPDAFATTQVIQVAGTDETCLWIYKAVTELFIGTTKDIYILEGTGAENPDGSVDFLLRGLSMDHKPINEAVAHEGNQIVYFSDDGWRGFNGSAGSTPLTGETSLLYRGQARHGVSAVNVQSGRFRAVLGRGKLMAITPEGASTTSSQVLYRYEFAAGRWFRHLYTPALRSIFREKDGTVLVGSSAGDVMVLDQFGAANENGAGLDIALWTLMDALDTPFQRKKAGAFTWHSDSGNVNESIAIHLDGHVAPTVTPVVNNLGADSRSVVDLANTLLPDGVTPNSNVIPVFRRIQFRVSVVGTTTYRFYDYGVQFRPRPIPMIGKTDQKLAGSGGVKIISGFQLNICTLGVARKMTAYLDGVADAETFTFTTDAEESELVPCQFTLTGRRASTVQLAFDYEVELDGWTTIVTQDQPIGVKVWDSGPILDNPRELSWLKALNFKVRASADLVVTPWFDGRRFPSVTIPVTADADTVYRIQVGKSYFGRQPRIVVKSCDEFFPYWVEPVRRDSGEPSQKSKPRQGMKVSNRR